ncbi:hypothetical protein [Azospirillum sp. TSO35-2]|uniref:hypothetical protein n=1 Tax=Azospirillum sp. TSO35-2 TaxID=716796 RepID=UPI000D60E214|nr:hypothetical protein [Azospirillum sp. TSO35-2]PWC37737.1 hypothetical protein TSO352_09555 [Azospirillum sp. TSO35-2]
MPRPILALALTLSLAMAAVPASALTVRTAGEPEAVTSWQRDACDRTDSPDTPARAFRDATGTVHLVASHATARALTGRTLDAVRPNCAVIFQGHGQDEPGLFDDRSWISSFYTLDGTTVYALVSNEFHGDQRRALCPSGQYMRCWRNSITAAVSTDGGASFHLGAPPPNHTVATLPYPYGGDIGRRTGYFAPSNIVRRDGHWYAFVWAEGLAAQKRGACLLRTDTLADPQAWRAWDGKDFSVRFVRDAQAGGAPDRHTCAPVAPDVLQGTVRSVVRHRSSGLYIATVAMSRDGGTGMWTTTSPDLVTWSKPQLLWAAPLLFRYGCGDAAAFDYPALLDPASQSANFEDVGKTAYVYMTRLNLDKCKITWNRDLVRLPVTIE